MFHAQHAAQNYRVFIEFGSLSGFLPSARTAHVGDAQRVLAGIYPAYVLVDQFGPVSGRQDAGWRIDPLGHNPESSRSAMIAESGW
jgi:hypothetical protein